MLTMRTPYPTLRSGVGLIIIVMLLCSALTVSRSGGAHDLPGVAPVTAAQLSAAEWGQIAPLMGEAEYQATPRARTDGKAAFWAPNRAHGLSLSFGPDGLEVTPWQGDNGWSLNLRTIAYGPEDRAQALSGMPALHADRQQVEYRWPGVREWYINSAEGLKHNITLEQPIGADRLQVDLALGGTLRPRVGAGGQAARFVDAAGASVLDFGPLYVYDADGRTLEAHFGEPRDEGATLSILLETQGARFPITIDPLLTSPKPKITASPIQAGAQFGFAVAADGEALVVGAFFEDGFGTPNKGAAYVFTRNRSGADNWGQVRKLAANDGAVDDNFGASVDVAGDVVVVGSPRADALGVNDGAAYVFERHLGGPDNWGLKKKLVASSAHTGDEFGFAVTVSGDAIAVGAPNDDTRATDAGAVYLFHRFSGAELNWGEMQQIAIFGGQAGDKFGFALAMEGRTLAVGAPNRDARGTDSGEVWVFKRHRSTADRWQQERCCLVGGDSAAGDNFGRAVAIDGDIIVAGAPFHDVSGATDRGTVYLFGRNQGGLEVWGQTKQLLLNGGAAGDRFGEGVAVDGAVVVAGAPRDDDELGGRADAGSIAVFVDGQQLVKLTAADRQADDRFGFAVAVSGDLVVAGTPLSNASATDAGAAYLFTLASETWSETRLLDILQSQGQVIALDNDTLAVGAVFDTQLGGAVYIFERNRGGANAWGQARKIANPQPQPSKPFGNVVALDGDLLAVSAQNNAVYLFERNRGGAGNWGEQKRFSFATGFGAPVLALDGNTLAVGVSTATAPGAESAGQIEVFERNLGGLNAWGRADLLTIADAGRTPKPNDFFGFDVAIDGNTLVSGSQEDDLELNQKLGAGYVFEREAGGKTWRFVKRLEQAQPTASFGGAVAIKGDIIAIGTLGHFDPTSSEFAPGSVSIFGRNQGGPNNWGEAKRLTVPAEARRFGAALALNGDVLAVGAQESDLRGSSSGAVYLFERNIGGVEQWGMLATLIGSAMGTSSHFGNGVALDGNTLVAGAHGSMYFFTNPVRATTGLGLQAAANPIQPGESIAVTAMISGESGAAEGEAHALGLPRGEVAFFLNGEAAGTVPLDTHGQARIRLPGLPQGRYELTARFAGNDNWAPCEAPPLTLFVGLAAPPAPDSTTVFMPLVSR